MSIDAAAALIAAARRDRQPIPRLSEQLRPASLADAYAIQDRVAHACGAIGGWKVGQSPGGEPSCAPVFAADIVASGVSLDVAWINGPAAEIEFAFRLDRNLPTQTQPYRAEDILSVFSFVPLIEVIGGRFLGLDTLSPLEKLADQNSNEAFIVGDAIADWHSIDFRAVRVELLINGEVRQSALDTHPTGSPVPLLVWQANHCVERGLPLKPGDIVTTGSLQGATPFSPGDTLLGVWEGLGEVGLRA